MGKSNANKGGDKKRSGGCLKPIGVTVLVLLVAAVALVLLAPSIVGALARGPIERAIADTTGGTVTLDSARFSWTGTQVIGPIRIENGTLAGGDQIRSADVTLTVDQGLLAITGMHLGTATLTGEATLFRPAATLSSANATPRAKAAPTKAPAAAAPSIPSDLRGRLVIDGFDLRVEQEGVGAFAVPALDATAEIAPGQPITLTLDAALRRGASLAEVGNAGGNADGATDAGSIKLDAAIDKLIATDGTLAWNAATVEATIDARGVDTGAIDALAGLPDAYAGALGPALDASVSASGALLAPVATIGATAEHLDATLELRKESDAIVAEPTDAIRLDTPGLLALPTIAAQLESAGLALAEAPTINASVRSLRIPLNADQSPDAGGASFEIALTTTDAAFTIAGDKLGRAEPTVELRLPPASITATTAALGDGVTTILSADIRLDGTDAGRVRANAVVASPLDSPTVTAEASIRGVPTVLLEPFTSAPRLELAQALGPALDASLVYSPSSISVDASSAHMTLRTALQSGGEGVYETNEPVRLTLARPAKLIDAYAAPAGVLVDAAGEVSLTIPEVRVDLSGDAPAASASGVLRVGEIAARLNPPADTPRPAGEAQPAATPIAVGPTTLEFDVVFANTEIRTGDAGVRVRTDDVSGALGAGGLAGASPLPMAVDVRSLVFAIPSASDTTPPLDRLVVDASASLRTIALAANDTLPVPVSMPSVTLSATAAPGEPIRVVITSEEGSIGPGELVGAGADGTPAIRLDQARVNLGGDIAIPTSALDGADALAIVRSLAGEVGVELAGVRVLAGGSLPDRIAMQRAALTTRLAPGEPVVVELDAPNARLMGLRITNADGTSRSLPNTVAAITAQADLPPAALLGGGASETVNATFSLETTTVEGDPVGSVEGSARVAMRAGTPDGPIDASLTARGLQLALIEPFVGGPGLLTGALGPAADAEATLTMRPGADGTLIGPLDARLALTSEHLRTTAPMRVTSDGSVLRLVEPLNATWSVRPALVDALLGGEEGTPGTSLARPATLRLAADELVVPLNAGATAPLSVQVSLSGDDLTLRLPDASERTFTGLEAQVRSTDVAGQALITAELSEGGREILSTRTRIDNITDASNTLTADAATLTGNIELTGAPAALVDAFAKTGDLAAGFLGSTMNAQVRYQKLNASGGSLRIEADTPNVEAGLVGVVRNGRFVINRPAAIRVNRIDQSFGTRLASVLPVFGSITKATSNEPAVVRAERLAIPLDGDIARYIAELTIDPGTATFGLEVGLGDLLNPAQFARGNRLGDSFQPFNATMRNGVLAVRNLALPIGEFSIPAQGDYDLVKGTERVVVQLPTGMLAAEAIGNNAGPLGDIVGNVLNVPLVKAGPLGGDNQWKPDPGARIDGAPSGQQGGDPASRLLDGIGDLLRRGNDD
ncbi:MAG: hypothetical protein AAF995_02105 [Planctomycetota bacterium]